jgi:hypothetical protein
MIYTCAVCNSMRYTHKGWNRPAVPWALKMEGSYCCSQCVADNLESHKFGTYATRGDLARCLLLYAWSGSGEDDFMSSESYGYCGRFGRYLLFEDSQGFVSYEDCGTEEKADKEFQRLYADGMGASEFDAFIYWDRNGYAVSFEGKPLEIWPAWNKRYSDEGITRRRAIARVRLESLRTGYYPNLWEESERGGLTLLSY